MMVTVIPNMPGGLAKVQAATPSAIQFATKDELLKNYKLFGSGDIARIKFGLNGSNSREWLIAGADGTDTLSLLSTSSFENSSYGSNSRYSDSTIANTVLPGYLSGTTYFSDTEKNYMIETTVSTTDWTNAVIDVTGKLYLANTYNPFVSSGSIIIYVGSGNNISILLSNLNSSNGFNVNNRFWLRSPVGVWNNRVFTDLGEASLNNFDSVNDVFAVVPAFNMDLSSVLFASAANAATSSTVLNGTLSTSNAMTLRYASSEHGSATINPSKTSVAVSSAPVGTYLVVQNSDGAWAKSVSGTDTVSVNDVTIKETTLTSLTGCKVWLESTDADRITTATLATQVAGYDVDITNPSESHISLRTVTGNGTESQKGLAGAITNVLYIADSGYYFPTDYNSDKSMDDNGVTVTRDSYTQVTVSGTPTANANVILIAATEKAVQNAPTELSDGVDKIAGTTITMEYASSADATEWKACTDDNTTVEAGTWYVRYQETDTAKASTATQVIVTESKNPPTLFQVTVNNGTGDGTYAENDIVTITADEPESGKQFKNWTVVSGEVSLTSSTSTTTTFTMPANAVEITATYEDHSTPPTTTYHSITAVVSPTNGGSVSGAGQVPDGGSKTLEATANSGFHFLNWTKDGNTVGTSSTLLLTNIVEDAEYTAFFTKKSNHDSKEEPKTESTHKEVTTPQLPSSLPYLTTRGTFVGEKNAFNIKALEPNITSTRNQSTLANYFTTQYFKRRTGTIMACYDMHAPWGAKKEWKDGICKFAWNIDNITAGDTIFVIWYNENNPLGAQFITATVSANDLITFTIPYLGDVSTISVIKVE